jgi:hypothetical protein
MGGKAGVVIERLRRIKHRTVIEEIGTLPGIAVFAPSVCPFSLFVDLVSAVVFRDQF